MIANPSCVNCVLSKQIQKVLSFPDEAKRSCLIQEITDIIERNSGKKSAPWLQRETDSAINRYYPSKINYSELKSKYNRYMLSKEAEMEKRILASKDAIEACIRFACAGNYIDFSALSTVSDAILSDLIEKAGEGRVNTEQLSLFRNDLSTAHSLIYIADNCGEIVTDKLFIKTIAQEYPGIDITMIVRGGEAGNDATMEDAVEAGLPQICRCIGNGSNLMGTDPSEISEEAITLMRSADIIISKGQANFETLIGEGFDPYYLFMCKCDYFMNRFRLAQFSSVFIRESSLEN